NQPTIKSEYDDLRPVFIKYYEKDIAKFENQIRYNKSIIDELKDITTVISHTNNQYEITDKNGYSNPLWINECADTCSGVCNNEIGMRGFTVYAGSEVFKIMPTKYKSKITKLVGVYDIASLKECPHLKAVEFSEELTYGITEIIIVTPGMLPDSLEYIEFNQFNNVIIKKGALPKNIKEIQCGPYVTIEDTVPPSVKLNYCNSSNINRGRVIKYNSKIEDYNNAIKNNTLRKDITDLSLWIDDYSMLKYVPPTVKTLILATFTDNQTKIDPTILPPSLKYIVFEGEDYKYKDTLPKHIKVIGMYKY
ncbi:MAG: hypothetical protein Homavirus13_13, partial [Homavirus sp.]